MPTKRVYVRCGLLGLLLAVFVQPVFAGEEPQRSIPAEKGLTIGQRPKGDDVEVVITWTGLAEPMVLAVAISNHDANVGLQRELVDDSQKLSGLILVRSIEGSGSDSVTVNLPKARERLGPGTLVASVYLTVLLDIVVVEDRSVNAKDRGKIVGETTLRSPDCRRRLQLLCRPNCGSIEVVPGSEARTFDVPPDGGFQVRVSNHLIDGFLKLTLDPARRE